MSKEIMGFSPVPPDEDAFGVSVRHSRTYRDLSEDLPDKEYLDFLERCVREEGGRLCVKYKTNIHGKEEKIPKKDRQRIRNMGIAIECLRKIVEEDG